MDLNLTLGIVGVIVLVLASFWGIHIAGSLYEVIGRTYVYNEAIKAGAGFWACNPKTGAKRFAWVTKDDKKEEHDLRN